MANRSILYWWCSRCRNGWMTDTVWWFFHFSKQRVTFSLFVLNQSGTKEVPLLYSLIKCFFFFFNNLFVFFIGELPVAPSEICIVIYLSYILYISKFFIHLQWHHASFMTSSTVFAAGSKHILHVMVLPYVSYFTLSVWERWKMQKTLLISFLTTQ